MQKTFEAVYEHGVLRPLEKLDLADFERVQVTISPISGMADEIAAYFEPEEWEASKRDDISLAEVRQALSSIRGSLSDAVIRSRDERL
jgi:predicted DNA-binding antitoxin AbrB/MazE fold protein